jgi:hypothetical protein
MLLKDSVRHDTIPVPSLVIYSIPHTVEGWVIESTNENIRSEARRYFSKIDSLAAMQANAFQKDVPSAQVVRLRGMHHVFISNEQEVTSTIRQFLRRLK